jgi:hypothetical protein
LAMLAQAMSNTIVTIAISTRRTGPKRS